MADIATVRELIALCRSNGVLHVKFGDIELVLAQSALDTEEPTVTPPEFDLSEFGADGGDPYENPALYPGGQDPVATLRQWKADRLSMEREHDKTPPTG